MSEKIYVIVIIFLLCIICYLFFRQKGVTNIIQDLERLLKKEKLKCPYYDIDLLKDRTKLNEIAKVLSTTEDQILDEISGLLRKLKVYKKEMKKMENKLAKMKAIELRSRMNEKHHEYNIICGIINDSNHKELTKICTYIIQEKNTIVFLMNDEEEKVNFVIGASEDLVTLGFNSTKLANKLVKCLNGKSGGTRSFASGMLEGIERVDEALSKGKEIILEDLNRKLRD